MQFMKEIIWIESPVLFALSGDMLEIRPSSTDKYIVK